MKPAGERPYHHGDLRAALLAAGEAELVAAGIEGFSMRAVARRAGVSHAAPAHHFGDTQGLLSALAAEGFRRFLAMQAAREAQAPTDPASQLTAAGLGYIDFALARPALFRLMFGSAKPDFASNDLHAAGEAAYDHLAAQVEAVGGDLTDLAAVWSVAHGLADLLMSGRLASLQQSPAPDRDATLAAIIRRALPAGR
jgi:AcrR family transcriptional regulator